MQVHVNFRKSKRGAQKVINLCHLIVSELSKKGMLITTVESSLSSPHMIEIPPNSLQVKLSSQHRGQGTCFSQFIIMIQYCTLTTNSTRIAWNSRDHRFLITSDLICIQLIEQRAGHHLFIFPCLHGFKNCSKIIDFCDLSKIDRRFI
jgi:hypothetical protein